MHHCAKFESAGHLNNARWIDGPQVANCGVEGHDRLIIVPQLWECIGRDIYCLFTIIIFHGQYLTQICYKWRLQKILSNFELVMNFGRFGQTTVDQSLWIVYETFRLVQMLFCGHNTWHVYHHTIMCFTCMMLNWIFVDACMPNKMRGPEIWVLAWISWKFQTKIGNAYRANIIWHATMHSLFAIFDAIFEQMPGELMVHKSS